MDWRAKRFERQAAIMAVLVSMLFAVPSAAGQSTCQSRDRIGNSSRIEASDCLRFSGEPRIAEVPEAELRTDAAIPIGTKALSISVLGTTDALLEQMSLSAGVIFAGEVVAVRRPAGFAGSNQAAAEGVVEIDLRVDQPLRGPAAGSIYTLREWAGRWAGQAQRYRVGRRLLLFLYPPGRDGISAPVHGAEGAIPLHGSGPAPGPDDDAATPAEWLVDLRWLRAQVLRRHLFETTPERSPVFPMPARSFESARSFRSDSRADGSVSNLSLIHPVTGPGRRPAQVPIEAQPLSQVLALCHEAITLNAMARRDEAPR